MKKPKPRPYEMHVISNTHWDREWRRPFQHVRMMLVDIMDTLLHILDTHPDYTCYHLDSQTVVLEDYLEIRPEMEAKIKRYVKEKRIWVGPWYTAPDMNGISGESIVRNLLLGHKIAREFGGVMKVGYTPFSFGHTAQLPQIYAGFGIDTCMFYRGVGRDRAKAEFWWESPDGSRALCSQFSRRGRYNFYFHVYRPTVDGRPHTTVTIDWDEIGLPVRCADMPNQYEAIYAMNHVSRFLKEKIGPGIHDLLEEDRHEFTTRHLLLMQGCDTTAPNPEEPRIIREADRCLKEGRVFQSSLPEYVAKLRREVKNLPVLKGEMRVPAKKPGSSMVMGDGISARMYLKQANACATTALERWAEPMAVADWLEGAEYPERFIEIAWKHLLQNHAHDSIMACSVDEVHEDMVFRFEQTRMIGEEVARRALSNLTRRIDTRHLDKDGSVVTVWNSLPYPRTDVMTVTVDFPKKKTPSAFVLKDADGRVVPMQVRGPRPVTASVQLRTDWPQVSAVNRYDVDLLAKDLPGMGYAAFTVTPCDKVPVTEGLATGRDAAENAQVRLSINRDGSFNVTQKKTRKTYANLNVFEDNGSAGTPWSYAPPKKDRVFSTLGKRAKVTLEENGPARAVFRVEQTLRVPASGDATRRSSELALLPIVSRIVLKRDVPWVEVETEVDNRAVRDHRLRAVFPTGLKTDQVWTDRPFNVIEHPIPLPDSTGWAEPASGTRPQLTFMGLNDGTRGLAVLVDGLPEGEAIDDRERRIAVTLLRTLAQVNLDYAIPPPKREGLQCLGIHTFRYAVYPHAGDWEAAAAPRVAQQFATPLRAMQSGRNEGAWPLRQCLVQLGDGPLVFSGIKRSENGRSMIVRVFNPTTKTARGTLETLWPVIAAHELTLEEKRLGALAVKRGNQIALRVGPKKIYTVELKLGKA